jgi:hypothetical protein
LYQPSSNAGPVRLGDLAVSRSGRVVVLDIVGRRLMAPSPSGLDLRSVARLDVEPSSVTLAADGRIAYVAHADGIARIDVERGAVSELSSATRGTIAGFQRIRVYRDGLVGLQSVDGGFRRLVFLPLTGRGSHTGIASILDVSLPRGDQAPFLTVYDDEVAFLLTPVGDSSDQPSSTERHDSVIHRIRLE